MRPIELFQGTDRDIVVKHDDVDLASATEIEALINSNPQIIKKLSTGGVHSVTATQFVVSIADTDTSNTKSGEYAIEFISTDVAGKRTWGDAKRSLVKIIDSKFTSVP